MKGFVDQGTAGFGRFIEDVRLVGEVIWDNKGKCALAFLATIMIPLGCAAAIPIIQKFRKLRREHFQEIQATGSREIPKKMEPI